MNYHVKNTRTFLPYVKTCKKINSRENVPWWTWKQGDGVRGFGCLKYMNVGQWFPLLRGAWTLPTFALDVSVYLRCSASPLFRVTLFSLVIERGENSPWQLETGLDYWLDPGVTRSWPDIAVPWYYVEHKPFHMTPTTHKAILLWKMKTKPRSLYHIWTQKQKHCPNPKNDQTAPVSAHMH